MENCPSLDNDEDTSSEECLRSVSESFDPLKVLYSKKVYLPTKKCRTYDNLASFESAIKKSSTSSSSTATGDKGKSAGKSSGNKKQAQSSTSKTQPNDSSDTMSQRRFLPHQMALKSEGALKNKHLRNILLRMKSFDGPLAALRKYSEENIQVKIYTRKEKGIRGYTVGYIIAFDVHWNVLLRDAYEVWKRRKYKFSENNAFLGEPTNCSKRLKKLGIKIPEVTLKSLNRKYVQCSRNVDQIMIRGEQIVLIYPISNDNSKSSH